MIDLYDLSPDELTELLAGWGEPGFRARQLSSWLYEKLSASFDAMTNLPASLRARLAQETILGSLVLEDEEISHDGTVKRLYRLHDGQLIESVLM